MDRQEILTYIIIGFIIYICLQIYRESDTFNLKCIISEVDGNKYCVRDRIVTQEAADLLAKTVTKMKSFVMYMKRTHPEHKITKRLLKGLILNVVWKHYLQVSIKLIVKIKVKN